RRRVATGTGHLNSTFVTATGRAGAISPNPVCRRGGGRRVTYPAALTASTCPPGSLNTGATMKRIAAAVSLITSLCVAWPAAGAAKPTVVELWPGKVPDEAGDIGPEKVRMSPKLTRKEVEVTEPTRLVTNVSKPTLTIYRPAKEKDTGAAV